MSVPESKAYVGPEFRDILSRLWAAASLDALREALVQGAAQTGFEYVALVRHGRLPGRLEQDRIVTNCHADLVDAYLARRLHAFDPVHDAAQRIERPFTWDEIPDLVTLEDRQIDMLNEARMHGLVHAVTVPLRVPGEPVSSCSFMSSSPVDTSPDLLAALEVMAFYGFMAALLLHHCEHPSTRSPLTRREAECTALVAQGKTDWEAGKILGIGHATVKYHVDQAKRRYRVYKRAHLVALFLIDTLMMKK
ncbi:MAG: LuxR family transcriptional regulator [Novosphingobium sp.]|jgi:LuxR family quorum-sensing system transcriptional regulator CciR|nr:LuxR family transcriptional regulator [Novosphingobium sp.]